MTRIKINTKMISQREDVVMRIGRFGEVVKVLKDNSFIFVVYHAENVAEVMQGLRGFTGEVVK